MSETDEIIQAVARYQPEQGNWLSLDLLIQRLWGTQEPQKAIDTLFGVFERFPDHDGYGVFWTILHGLESLPDYEPALIASLRRQPTEFNVLMVNRILNAGATVGDIDGLTLLEELLNHSKASDAIKREAQECIMRHQTSR